MHLVQRTLEIMCRACSADRSAETKNGEAPDSKQQRSGCDSSGARQVLSLAASQHHERYYGLLPRRNPMPKQCRGPCFQAPARFLHPQGEEGKTVNAKAPRVRASLLLPHSARAPLLC